jgi:hypothetical protein
MKRLLVFLAVIGFAASLGAQSLVELAKREKERREGLKGRQAVVVKNNDLMKVKKVPGVEVAPPVEDAADAAAAGEEAGEPETIAGEEGSSVPPSGSGAPSGRRMTPRMSAPGPTIMGENAEDQTGSGGPIEAQLKSAVELVDLLTTKMNALRQQYEAQDAMVPGYVIQKQMDETNQRLVKAQAQEARIRSEMEKKGLAKKSPAPEQR